MEFTKKFVPTEDKDGTTCSFSDFISSVASASETQLGYKQDPNLCTVLNAALYTERRQRGTSKA